VEGSAWRLAGVDWRLIAVNPSDGATAPKVEQPKLRVPTPADVGRLLEAVRSDYRAPVALIASTGLRRGEALALEWPAVSLDPNAPTVRVEGTLQRANGTLRTYPPKTERSRRVVPLSPSTAAMLRVVRKEQNERRLVAGAAWESRQFVFDRGDGKPLDPDTLSKEFRRAADSVGLDGTRLHDMRHAFASMMIGAGTGARVVADLLGHATVGFTLHVYTHPTERDAAEAAATTERLLGRAMAWDESGTNRPRR
jgi:integrase